VLLRTSEDLKTERIINVTIAFFPLEQLRASLAL